MAKKMLLGAILAMMAPVSWAADGSLSVELGSHVASVSVSWADGQGIVHTNVCTQSGSVVQGAVWEGYGVVVNGISVQNGYQASGFSVLDNHYDESAHGYVTTTNSYSANAGRYTPQVSDARVTVCPRAAPVTNTIIYVVNSGTLPADSPTTYTIESPTVTLPTPTRTGYDFGGWHTNASFEGAAVASIPTGSTGNRTFHAKWNACAYTVTFDANYAGGTVVPSSKSVTYASTYGDLPTPTRTGYTFAGWWTAASGGAQVKADTVVSITAPQTLYAHWTANGYTLTINPNGGTYSGQTTRSLTFGSTQNNSIGKPTRTGYIFEGWWQTRSGQPGSPMVYDTNGVCVAGYWWTASGSAGTFKVAGDLSVSAKWTACAYSVRFNANASECSGTMDDQAMAYGAAQNLTSNAFERTGYTFTGWATSASGNVAYSDGQSVTNLSATQGAVVELYAKWTANPYTLTINPNGGTYNGSTERTQKPLTFGTTLNNSIGKPTRSGYVFGGWWQERGGQPGNPMVYDANGACVGGYWWTASGNSGTFNVAGDLPVIAKWTAGQYTVSFNVNGGSGEFDPKTVTYGSTYGALPVPSRTGHDFAGWWTMRDGGTQVTASTTVSITSAQTLYAHWTPQSYSVTFHFDGGWISWGGTEGQITSSPFVTNYTYGAGLSMPSFGRTGYLTGGWHLAEDCGDPAVYSIGTSDTGDRILWAKFTPRTYTVALDNQGADVSGTSSVSVNYNGDFPAPINCPKKAGYEFNGYFAQVDGQGTQYYDAGGAAYGNVWTTADAGTIYAQWLPNAYRIAFEPGEGGTGEMEPMALTYGVETNLPPVEFAREGYVFAGWKTNLTAGVTFADGQAVSNLTTTTNATVTMTATWAKGFYYVAFDANGGEGEMDLQKFTYDVSEPLASNAFTRAGYDFAGWAWTANATTNDIAFTNCETVVNLAAVVDSTNTLYAVWKAEEYEVVLDANEGQGGYFLDGEVTNLTKTIKVTYGSVYDLPVPSNVKTWMTFAEWKYVDGETGATNALPATVPLLADGVTNLVARWTDGLADALNAEGTKLSYETGGKNRTAGGVDMDVFWAPADKDGVLAGQSGVLPSSINSSYTYVRATLPGEGVLTFTWRVEAPIGFWYEGDEYEESRFMGNSLTFVNASSSELVSRLASGNNPSSQEWRDTGWQTFAFTNDTTESVPVEWRFEYTSGKPGGGTGWVDNVTWTPTGDLKPGKVPLGENGASPMTIGNGQTTVYVANTVQGWWYGLYSKTNLADTAEEWTILPSTVEYPTAKQATGDDVPVSFAWPWNLSTDPQRFFKIILSIDNPCKQ